MPFKISIIMLVLCQAGALSGQEFLIISSNRELFSVNIGNCTARFVSSVLIQGGGSISDITYTPDGRLWGITTDGRLFTIAESTGQSVLAHTFPSVNDPFFTSLVADGVGRIYSASGNGALYVYDINTMAHTYLGNIGYGAAGDLTFYQGGLLMASTNNQMIQIDLENPANSTARMSFNAGGQIFGIVTFVEDCENTVTYATNDAASGRVFQIDFDTGQLTQACALGIRIFGAASLLEFLAADPVVIDEVTTTPFICAEPGGTIDLLASGGNGPLLYSLDNVTFQPGGYFSGLAPGDYTVFVRDGRGCAASQAVTVGSAAEVPGFISLAIEADSCGLGLGAVLAEASGGVPPYQFALNGGAAAGTPLFAGLAGGVYELAVTDSEGCRAVQTITIPGGPGPRIERLDVQPCGPGQNTITIDASGGDGTLAYSLGNGPEQASPVFTAPLAGAYEVAAIDEAGCSDSRVVDIPVVEPLEFVSIEVDACGQGNSSLLVEASGGTGLAAYSLDGGPAQSTGSFENLDAGAYTLLAADANGCTATAAVSIPEYEPPRILRVETAPSQCGLANGALHPEISGGSAPFLYSLDGDEQAIPQFAGLPPGLFLLSVTDANGCSATDTVQVGQLCPVYVPNAFSPNADGFNDRFELYSGAEIQILAFRIFNRWGGLVYEQSGFSSADKSRFWGGQFNGAPAPAGVYVFYVEVLNGAGEEESFEGEVLLLR